MRLQRIGQCPAAAVLLLCLAADLTRVCDRDKCPDAVRTLFEITRAPIE